MLEESEIVNYVMRNVRKPGAEFSESDFRITEIGSYKFETMTEDSCYGDILLHVAHIDDFEYRWQAFCAWLDRGVINAQLFPPKNPLVFFGFNNWAFELFRKKGADVMRVIPIEEGFFISEMGLMLLLTFFKLVSGQNYMYALPYYAALNREDIYSGSTVPMNSVQRTVMICLYELARRLNVVEPREFRVNNLFQFRDCNMKLPFLVDYVNPISKTRSDTPLSFLHSLCLLVRGSPYGTKVDVPYDYLDYMTHRELRRFTSILFRRKYVDEMLHTAEHYDYTCDHSFFKLQKERRELMVRPDIEVLSDDTDIRGIKFYDQIVLSHELVDQLLDFDKKILIPVEEKDVQIKKMEDLINNPGSVAKPQTLYDLLAEDKDNVVQEEYPVDKFLSTWIQDQHKGAYKNMFIFLDFVKYYYDYFKKYPKAPVVVIGCGSSSWYQFIALFFYDRKVIFIDKEVKVGRVQKMPNVEVRCELVDKDYPIPKDAILMMDISRGEDDYDCLEIQQSLARKSGIFFYKVRSNWLHRSCILYGDRVYMPCFGYYGSSELRVFGSQGYGKDRIVLGPRDAYLVSTFQKYVLTSKKCRSCVSHTKFIKDWPVLPQMWLKLVGRESEMLKMQQDTVIFNSDHKLGSCSIFLDQCVKCHYYYYRELSEWLLPFLNYYTQKEMSVYYQAPHTFRHYEKKHSHVKRVLSDLDGILLKMGVFSVEDVSVVST